VSHKLATGKMLILL